MTSKSKSRARLPAILKANKQAMTVLATIVHLARGRRRVGFTREQIRSVCGVGLKGIGKAVGVLHKAGVIRRTYLRSKTDKRLLYYSILLPKDPFRFLFLRGKNDPEETQSPGQKRPRGNAKSAVSYGPKMTRSSLTRRASDSGSAIATPDLSQAHSRPDAPPEEQTVSIIDALGLKKRGAS